MTIERIEPAHGRPLIVETDDGGVILTLGTVLPDGESAWTLLTPDEATIAADALPHTARVARDEADQR